MDKNIFLYALGGVSTISLLCGLMLGAGKGAAAIGLLLAIGLGLSLATIGSGALLIAAYVGAFVLVAAGVGLTLGAALRGKR